MGVQNGNKEWVIKLATTFILHKTSEVCLFACLH
jgi:hypothetical protein